MKSNYIIIIINNRITFKKMNLTICQFWQYFPSKRKKTNSVRENTTKESKKFYKRTAKEFSLFSFFFLDSGS